MMKSRSPSIILFASCAAVIWASVALFWGAQVARATPTNINSNVQQHWAWNDIIGWIDFYNNGTSNVFVQSSQLNGDASSSVGVIALNCADHSCAYDYKVTNNGVGTLSGWAWNDALGWISFSCQNTGTCGTVSYGVLIDASGVFSGYAWNDVVGWISFNCSNYSGCGTSQYSVITSWIATSTLGYVDSTTYDTRSASGSQLNSVLWRGSQPLGTTVKFQFAVGNTTSGAWTSSFLGPNGTINDFYIVNPDVVTKLDWSLFNNYRYFRYRATLVSNQAQTSTPRIDDIIINWSP